MDSEKKSMSVLTFGLGLLALGFALFLAELISNQEATGGIAGPVGFGFGGVIGGMFWGLVVWGLMRLGAGKDKPLDSRKIVFITTAVIAAAYLLLRLLG